MLNAKALMQAKILRKRMTKSEKVLWQELRSKKLGIKFRRQMPLVFENYHFVADFYCADKRLIIEIDGDIHNDIEVKGYDEFREDILIQSGYKVIRFKNNEVINNLKNVLIKIKSIIK